MVLNYYSVNYYLLTKTLTKNERLLAHDFKELFKERIEGLDRVFMRG